LAYVWATLFIIWGTDVFAYYVGKKIRQSILLYPQISPKKTLEGAIGGFCVAIIFASTVLPYWPINVLFACHPFKFNLMAGPAHGGCHFCSSSAW
jgi:CDP-diglyceride synthetase